MRNKKPRAKHVEQTEKFYKEITFPTIMEVVQAIQREGKVIKIWLKKQIL